MYSHTVSIIFMCTTYLGIVLNTPKDFWDISFNVHNYWNICLEQEQAGEFLFFVIKWYMHIYAIDRI